MKLATQDVALWGSPRGGRRNSTVLAGHVFTDGVLFRGTFSCPSLPTRLAGPGHSAALL